MTTPGWIGGRDHFNDFDMDSPEFRDNYAEVLDELLDKCPVARSEADGGYWVVTRAEDFKACAIDYETFTSTRGFEPSLSNEGEGGAKLYPLQIDPPYQTRWRKALNKHFTGHAVKPLKDSMREHVTELINGFIENGHCDFVEEFAAHLPGYVFFGSFLGVPLDDLESMQKATDDAIRGPAEGRAAAWQAVGDFLSNYLQAREHEPPRGDFVDTVLEGIETDDGEPCPWEHKVYIMIDVLAGGMGTSTHTLAAMAHHLATHPEDTERLLREPEIHINAVDEISRVNAPVWALGRTATRDTEIAGQKIAEGELVMLSEAAACRDPRALDAPQTVDLDRQNAVNLAFSYGPHRCIGSQVARLEMVTTLEEVLRRVPDLAVAPEDAPDYSNSGVARSMDRLPLVFTPGAREGGPT